MRIFLIILCIVIAAAILLLSVFFATRPNDLIIQGLADATEITVSSKVPGRIENIYVKEGDMVTAGQLLVTLDAPDVKAKVVQATAAQRAAEAQRDKADTGARQEDITSAYNVWQKALVNERVSKQTNDRIQQLYREGVVSAQQRDEAQAKYDAAVNDTRAAKSQYDMSTNGTRQEDKEAAEAQVEQASGAVQEAESYLDDTILYSPIDGEVSVVVLNPGELAGTGTPLITITDLTDVYFIFNIREDLMPNFTMGSTFNARIPGIDTNVSHELRITYIAPRGDFSTWSATKTTGQFDLRTFEVRARPVNPIPNLRPGMSAVYYLPQ